MERYEQLKRILKERKCFKLVCGAGNEDTKEVKRLVTIYTIAGAHILDLSANIEVVEAAKKGVAAAYKIAEKLGKEIKIKPYLNVSIGLKGDPHLRKARINPDICTQCKECIDICRQQAITKGLKIQEYRCIGCGDCENVCEFKAIYFIHKKSDFDKVLPDCLKQGIELMELHAVTEDDAAVFDDWKLLNNLMQDNFLTMCLDRHLLSNKGLIERVKKAYEITKERLIIQADGVPMSGEADDYNTTIQAVACADIIQKSGIPVMLLLSGGTNSKTGLLVKQCGIEVNGVAIGSWARKIVKGFIKGDDFDSHIDVVRKAVSMAEDLIKSNIEAISGQIRN